LIQRAALRMQQVTLFHRLHAFGDDGQSQALAQHDDAADDAGRGRIVLHPAHEALVDLELVDGKASQVGQGRIAGPEIIERNL